MEKIISPGVFQSENDQSAYSKGPEVVGAAIVGPTVHGLPYAPTYVTSYSEYQRIFGETFKSGSNQYEYFTSLAAKDYFSNGGKTLLVTRIIESPASASVYASASILDTTPTTPEQAFKIETLSWGAQMNNSGSLTNGSLALGSSSNIKVEIDNVSTTEGTFDISVRRGDDTDLNVNILEQWNNLSLDPMLPNYIGRVIGDMKPIFDSVDGYVEYNGTYSNNSQYIRVTNIKNTVDSIDNFGAFKTSTYGTYLPVEGLHGFSGGVAATTLEQLMNEAITITNIQGFTASAYSTAFSLLTNKNEYQFKLLMAPGVGMDCAAADDLIACAEAREDAIAIVDNGIYGTAPSAAATLAAGSSSSYAANYYPWVQVYSSNLGKVVWVPATTVVGGVYAFNDEVASPWFAPAGFVRGGIPSVVRTERRLQQSELNLLTLANVNPLATFPGEGVVVWGQKTFQRKATALDRVNVRKLLIELKGHIGAVARKLVFEQNTAVTRNKFLSQVNPYLESVVQRQGLYAFSVDMSDTNNTADVIDRNQLVGTIYIQPTKAVEYIVLNFNLSPTGSTFPA